MGDWDRKDEWHKRGKDFLVVISRHEVMRTEASIFDFDEGPHRWAVYAYIYPAHPHFAKFSGTDMWQDASNLGFHGGCSLLRYHHEADGKVTSVQCGGDYNHLHDTRFTNMATAEDARAVFNDADELFERLTRMGAA
jgi:hypothetical protein